MTSPLKVWFEADGRLLRLRLARPKANIIDAAMIVALLNLETITGETIRIDAGRHIAGNRRSQQ